MTVGTKYKLFTNIPGLFDLNIFGRSQDSCASRLRRPVYAVKPSTRVDARGRGPRGPNSVMHLYKGFSLARLDPETLPCFLGFPLVMSGREDHFASQRQWQLVPFPCTAVRIITGLCESRLRKQSKATFPSFHSDTRGGIGQMPQEHQGKKLLQDASSAVRKLILDDFICP